ncbi:MAG: hypothetical protein GWO07_07040 [Candidatus Dadabacteria bacterium]|nr:hypothetical protein [Candidatus Dadabacteria bacterium]NIT99658.1 hypothetical protein [Nitrosopumilaceae archaeon]NIU86043.1 hypothetical protein [Nitrosopumilaceae archaeon]NIX60261.1 hypothetical protein [Nitrosopumilaceae archaeon]
MELKAGYLSFTPLLTTDPQAKTCQLWLFRSLFVIYQLIDIQYDHIKIVLFKRDRLMRVEKTEQNPIKDNVLLATGFGFLAIGNLLALFTAQKWIPTIFLSLSIIICAIYIVLQFKK